MSNIKQYNKSDRWMSLNLALILFFAMNPYPRWMLPNGTYQIVFFLSTSLLIIGQSGRFLYTKASLPLFGVVFVYMLFFTTSLVHEFRSGHFLSFILFLLMILIKPIYYYHAAPILKKIFVWIAAFSLIIWLLNIVHFPLWSYTYIPDFRYSSRDIYKIYGLSISLLSGSHHVGGGLMNIGLGFLFSGWERICGVFAEPGHFGIYLGLILAIEQFNFKNKANKILLVAGLLTLSTAFYGILTIGIIYRFLSLQLTSYKFIIVLLITTIISTYFFSTIFKDTEPSDGSDLSVISMIENRTGDQYKKTFNYFVKSDDVFFGKGYFAEGMTTTNWRGGVYKFGLIGVSLMLLLILTIVSKIDLKYAILLFLIALLIMSHRIYIMYAPAIYAMFFAAVSVAKLKKTISNNGAYTKLE